MQQGASGRRVAHAVGGRAGRNCQQGIRLRHETCMQGRKRSGQVGQLCGTLMYRSTVFDSSSCTLLDIYL